METEFRHSPYKHLVMTSALPPDIADAALASLEKANWQPIEGPAFAFQKCDAQEVVRSVNAFEAMLSFCRVVGECFPGYSSQPHFSFQRYGDGAGIGFHSDSNACEVRAIINLNRNWELASGGIWVLSGDAYVSNTSRYIPPIHNSGFVFATSEKSFHALTNVSGELYAMIIAFKLK